MTAKKSIALLIALAMAVAMLAGCSSGTPTDANDPASAGDGSAAATGDERTPATFSLLQMAAATSTVDPWIDTPVGQYLQEKTNVELEIEFLVGSDVRQKASLLIAAGVLVWPMAALALLGEGAPPAAQAVGMALAAAGAFLCAQAGSLARAEHKLRDAWKRRDSE